MLLWRLEEWIITREKLTEDRICTVLREKLYSMADNESQSIYEPLQLKWILPIESPQGMESLLKNIVFLLGYVQENGCNRGTIDKIIENDICPMVSGLSNEYDFLVAATVIIMCSVDAIGIRNTDEKKELQFAFRREANCIIEDSIIFCDSYAEVNNSLGLDLELGELRKTIGQYIKDLRNIQKEYFFPDKEEIELKEINTKTSEVEDQIQKRINIISTEISKLLLK